MSSTGYYQKSNNLLGGKTMNKYRIEITGYIYVHANSEEEAIEKYHSGHEEANFITTGEVIQVQEGRSY